ncbi:MAG: DNA polymerase III subunit beta [bacterium]|nr:DNA polymerase III subunit beta [bacterium]
MKLQVTKENLNRAVSAVARIASSRNSLPILANLLIKTVDNRLVIAATNLDIAITEKIGAKISEPGSLTVPARLLQDFVANLPDGVVELEADDFRLRVSADKYKSTINGMSAEEYPVMPALQAGKSFSLPSLELKKALSQTVYAASSDDSRPVLTGVYLHTHEGKLYIVATDSYRLAEASLGASKTEVMVLIPASSFQELARVMGDHTSDEVVVTFDEQQVRFTVGDVEIITRLIEGNYPDYRRLIPANFSTQAEVSRNELLNITKVASLFAREAAGSIQISINEKDSSLDVKSIASQLGENNSSIEAKAEGSGTVTLNSRYLLDALNSYAGDTVKFCMNGKLEPCLVIDPSSDKALQIVMPVKS